jgi:hydrogen peroxide-dependent heme synthase
LCRVPVIERPESKKGRFRVTEFPPVPLTIEGSYVLHQLFEFDWKAWRNVHQPDRKRIVEEASGSFQGLETAGKPRLSPQSALYSVMGHKSDLMMLHFRDSVEDLNRVELTLAQTEFHSFLKARFSYLSVVELSLYESSVKTYGALAGNGLSPHTAEWNEATGEILKRQKEAMAQRLYPSIPPARHLCFYPMDRKREDNRNWYTLPLEERQRLMHDHGMIGRRYADRVRQVISGSIGLDDWEWAVDLFADDPVIFKQLIYEMRFDEASSLYASFGPFYVGIRLHQEELEPWLVGKLEKKS